MKDERARILWVGRDEAPALAGVLVESASSGAEGLARLRQCYYDAALASFPLPDCGPEELLEEFKRVAPAVPFLVQDPAGKIPDAVRLIKLGADYFFGGQVVAGEMAGQIEAAVELRRNRDLASLAAAVGTGLGEIPAWRRLLVGASGAMENVCHVIHLVGRRRCTVLVTGETGTGKEMVARSVHLAGNRAHLPMIAVNCTALPENLLEAELFGHVRGAFTGATNLRIGRFEQAHKSTIFLDEIGEMPLELQAKLLRVLQEREFQRIGSSETIRVDVRVIAASNCDLAERVRQGRFREDLYYRLNVVPIRMPALRDRRGDIPLLVEHFIDKICLLEQIPRKHVTREALARLSDYSWPGNVRQLENAVEMAIALSGDRHMLCPIDFPLPDRESRLADFASPEALCIPDDGLDFEQTVSQFERKILQQALQKTAGNKTLAADMLRLKRTTLTAKLRSLGATA